MMNKKQPPKQFGSAIAGANNTGLGGVVSMGAASGANSQIRVVGNGN